MKIGSGAARPLMTLCVPKIGFGFRHNGGAARTRLGSRQSLSLSETYTLKSFTERSDTARGDLGRHAVDEADDLQWLLRARRERPRRSAAKPSISYCREGRPSCPKKTGRL